MGDKKRELSGEDRLEMREMLEDVFDTFLEKLTAEGIKNGDFDEERAEVSKEKFRLLRKQARLERELGDVTSNTYTGIGKIMNELIRKQNDLLVWAHEECAKFLEENNLPAEELDEEEDEEIPNE